MKDLIIFLIHPHEILALTSFKYSVITYPTGCHFSPQGWVKKWQKNNDVQTQIFDIQYM